MSTVSSFFSLAGEKNFCILESKNQTGGGGSFSRSTDYEDGDFSRFEKKKTLARPHGTLEGFLAVPRNYPRAPIQFYLVTFLYRLQTSVFGGRDCPKLME